MIDIKFMRSAGLSDTQILDLMEAQRAQWREQKRNYRANVQRRPKTSEDNGLLKELPSIDLPSGKSISGRSKRAPKVSFPDPWPWPIKLEHQPEFENFKSHALENDRRSARWDLSWQRWLASPYRDRKPNGGHSNGNGRQLPEGNVSIADIHKIADEYRRREQISGADLFRAADDAGSHRRSG